MVIVLALQLGGLLGQFPTLTDYKLGSRLYNLVEPRHDKTNKMTCAPSEDSDHPGHPLSLIRAFAVRFMGS